MKKVHENVKPRTNIIPKPLGWSFSKVRMRIFVPKLREDFSSRSRKTEEECTSLEGRKGHGCEGRRESRSHPRRLFRGRALNFPRLNRSTAVMVVWCFLPLLSARVRRKVAKARVSSLPVSYIRGVATLKEPKLPLLREFEFLLDGLPCRLSRSKFMFRK